MGRSAKVKDGIISEAKFLGTISIDRYKHVLVKNNLLLTLNGFLTYGHFIVLNTTLVRRCKYFE
jgi:hypothetical protein